MDARLHSSQTRIGGKARQIGGPAGFHKRVRQLVDLRRAIGIFGQHCGIADGLAFTTVRLFHQVDRLRVGSLFTNYLQRQPQLFTSARRRVTRRQFSDPQRPCRVGIRHRRQARDADKYDPLQLRGVGVERAILTGVISNIRPIIEQNRRNSIVQKHRVIGRSIVPVDDVVELVVRALWVNDGIAIAVRHAPVLDLLTIGVAGKFEELLSHFVDESVDRKRRAHEVQAVAILGDVLTHHVHGNGRHHTLGLLGIAFQVGARALNFRHPQEAYGPLRPWQHAFADQLHPSTSHLEGCG